MSAIADGLPTPEVDSVTDDDQDIVTLVDEEGKEHDFQIVDCFEVNGRDYVLLIAVGGVNPNGDEDDEVLVMRFNKDNFEMIEDQAEFEAVVAAIEFDLAEEGDADV